MDTAKAKIDTDQWVEEYGDYLFSFAYQRVKNEDVARDLVQDAFLSALKAYKNFRGDSSLKTWLTTILKNKILDHFNREKTKNQTSLEEGTNSDFNKFGIWNVYVADWARNPESLLQDQQLKLVFSKCASKLKAVESQVFNLKYTEDLESEEICKLLGISESNLWVILHRVRNRLRICLEKNWYESR